MNSKSINKIVLLWLFILLPITSIIIFRKSFNLGLYGDDWQHLYILWRDFFVYKTKSFFDIRSYLNPYWPEYLYLGIIQHFWNYNPPAYFIASFVCRLFANIALYFFAYELTKSKLAAFLATLLFLVSAAGLQTTDWVFNMNTYFGLGLLLVSSIIYLKIRNLNTFKSWYYPLFIITFILALAVVPTRMHGAAPFIVLMDLLLSFIVEKKKIRFDKHLITRMLLALFIFWFLVQIKSFGEQSYTSGRFNDSYKLIQTLIQNGYHSWWLYFLGIIGHLVIPDTITLSPHAVFLQQLLPIKNTLTGILIIQGFLSTLFLSIGSYPIIKSKKWIHYSPILLFNVFWAMFLWVMNKLDSHTSNDIYFSISLGGQFLFWGLWFYIIGRKKYPQISSTLIISIFWIVALTFIYWTFTPYYVIETTGRYMTMGAAGMAFFISSLAVLLLKSSLSHHSSLLKSIFLGIPFLILAEFLIINFNIGQSYFDILYQTRNKDLTEKSWNKLLQEVPKLDPTAPSVFYFTTDNPLSLEGVFVFGFYMRAGLEWRIPVEHMTPLPCKDYAELLAYVKDGSPLQKVHGRKAEPVPLSRVFAFDFRNGELIPITDIIRQKLIQDLSLEQSN